MWSRRRDAQVERVGIVVTIEGMHCASCGLTVDDAVEDVPGVARSTTSFRTAQTRVVLADGADAATVGPLVVRAVETAGYRGALRDDGA